MSTLIITGSQRERWRLLQRIHLLFCVSICIFSKGCFKVERDTLLKSISAVGFFILQHPLITLTVTNALLTLFQVTLTLGKSWYTGQSSARCVRNPSQRVGFCCQPLSQSCGLGQAPGFRVSVSSSGNGVLRPGALKSLPALNQNRIRQ